MISIGFKEHLTLDEIKKILENLGLTLRRALGFKNTCLIGVPAGSEEDWVIKFQNTPEIRFAELEIIERIGPRS